MTRNQKTVLIMLALLLLLVGLIVWGLARPACKDCDGKNYRPSAAMKAIGSLFSSKRNRVELPKKRYQLGANQMEKVEIARFEGDARTLKLRRIEGAMKLSVQIDRPEAGVDPAQADPESLPRDIKDPEDRERMAYRITGGGARLTIECKAAPCVMETE